jgi:CRISPR-associated protein Cas1
MQLFLDSFGASLGVRNGMFRVKPRSNEEQLFAIREINAIFITKGVSVSSGALMLAIESQIPVVLIDNIGHPVGQVWGGQFGSIATIRKNQALFSGDVRGMDWMRGILLQKIDNQRTLLLRLMEREVPVEALPKLERAAKAIGAVALNFENWSPGNAFSFDDAAATFRGWEGTATRFYFRGISTILPEKYEFAGRSKRPAYDPFNALLNYCYGFLYALSELALMKAGLDPCMGILHADQYNRPTLSYDFIELWRHWAEDTAIRLCLEDQLPENAFYIPGEREGVWLDKAGKAVVINTFLKFLDEKTDWKGQTRRRSTHIDLEAQRLAALLK